MVSALVVCFLFIVCWVFLRALGFKGIGCWSSRCQGLTKLLKCLRVLLVRELEERAFVWVCFVYPVGYMVRPVTVNHMDTWNVSPIVLIKPPTKS